MDKKNHLLNEIVNSVNQVIDLVLLEQFQILGEAESSLPTGNDDGSMSDDAGMAAMPADTTMSGDLPDTGIADVGAGSTSLGNPLAGSAGSEISSDSMTGGDTGMSGMGADGGISDFSGGFGGGSGGGGGLGGDADSFSSGNNDDDDGEGDNSGQENFSSANPFAGITKTEDKLNIILSTAEDIAKQTQNPQVVLKHVKGLIQSGFSEPDKASILIANLFDTENPVLQQVSRRLALFTTGL